MFTILILNLEIRDFKFHSTLNRILMLAAYLRVNRSRDQTDVRRGPRSDPISPKPSLRFLKKKHVLDKNESRTKKCFIRKAFVFS